jgi:hypothetical protein
VTDGICSSVDHQKRFSAALGKALTIRASISRPTDDCPGDRCFSWRSTRAEIGDIRLNSGSETQIGLAGKRGLLVV